MGKTIGLFACLGLVALSVWWASSQQTSQAVLAQIDSSSTLTGPPGFGAPPSQGDDGQRAAQMARINDFMQKAVLMEKRGNTNAAIRFARSADAVVRSARVPLNPGVESPAQFISRLEGQPAAPQATLPPSQTPGNPFAAAPSRASRPAPTVPGSDSPAKRQAQEMLRQARKALDAGELDTARALALEAQKVNAAWGLFEETPDQVLADIERKTNTTTITPASSGNPFPPESPESQNVAGNPFTGPASNSSKANNPKSVGNPFAAVKQPGANAAPAPVNQNEINKAQANSLMAQAKEDAKAGRFQDARRKLEKAEQLDVIYTVLDERPELVLNDVNRMESEASKLVQITPRNPAPASPDDAAKREQAQRLLEQARADIRSSQFEAAKAKIGQVRQMNVTYNQFDDTPELVAELLKQYQQPQSEAPSFPDFPAPAPVAEMKPEAPAELKPKAPVIAPAPEPTKNEVNSLVAVPPVPAAEKTGTFDIAQTAPAPPKTETSVVHPSGVVATELYDRGLKHYMDGRYEEAYDALLHCYRTGQKMDPYRTQSLQEMLQTLRPLVAQQQNANTIRQVKNEEAQGARRVGPGTSAIDLAEKEKSVKFEKLRSEVLNAIFQADRLREKQPTEALELIDRTLANVSDADLTEQQLAPLVRQLQMARGDIEAWQKQKAPMLALEERNKEVKKAIQIEREIKVRVEQELAEMVEEYNNLFKQRRYAEAEVIAKKAKDLDPENPVTETMFWKARFARRDARNEELRLAKEEGFWKTLDNVEEALIPFDDSRPMQFPDPKKWGELTERRSGYGTDNRIRTEKEKEIEKSLSRPISLHFTETPLSEVLKHISTAAGINVVLDNLGLSEEGILPDQPVTIDVDGIMLSSALDLMLEQLDLSYMIESEVLKVTSRIRQQGTLKVYTYPVADLVIAIPNFKPSGGTGLVSSGAGHNAWNGPANFSIPAGGSLTPAGAQFQVGNQFGGPPPISDPWGAPGLESSLAGGGSAVDFDTLSDLIISTIEPESWAEAGGSGQVRAYETTLSLVIRQTQQVHEEIRDLLEQLRRLQDLQVTIEVRFITVADRFFERIGIDFDFNVQDTVEGDDLGLTPPPFGSPGALGVAGAQGQQGVGGGQQGGNIGVGGIGGGPGAMNALIMGVPGQVTGQGQQGGQQGGQQAQQGQQAGGGGQMLMPNPNLNLPALDDWPKNGTIAGLSTDDGMFTPDLDVQFRQGSFDLGVPDFGSFNPDAGITVGMAILTDIEAFFFINAAQADERTNIMFAPKVTLFNGQQATVQSTTQRPFVTSLIPTVGFFSVGFTPQITVLSEGVVLQVLAVISADRRFVRLTVVPNFTNITDVFTFTFSGPGAGGQVGAGGAANNGVAGQGGFQPIGGQGGQQGGAQAGFGGIGGGPVAANALSLGLPTQIGGGLVGGQVGGVGGGQVGGNVGGQVGAQAGFASGVGNTTIQQPVFEVVNVTTTVSVPDGGTVLLGGIKRLREGRSMAGVPILNKIPYISRLFKNTGVGRETESLMLMVTPRIIIQEEEEALLGLPPQ